MEGSMKYLKLIMFSFLALLILLSSFNNLSFADTLDDKIQKIKDLIRESVPEPVYYEKLGWAYLRRYEQKSHINDIIYAIELFRKTALLDPDAFIYYSLGYAYFNLGDLERAQRAINKALLISPGYSLALNMQAAIYDVKGEYDKALEGYNESKRRRPQDEWIPYNLAWLYLSLGEYDQAMRYAKKALEINKDFIDVLHVVAEIYRYMGNPGEAVSVAEKILKTDPGQAGAYSLLSQAQYDLGFYDKAEMYAKKYTEINPDSGWGYELQAKVLKKQLKDKQMRRIIREAEDFYIYRLKKGANRYTYNLAWIYAYYDIDPKDALWYAKKTIEIEKTPNAFEVLALAYYKNFMYKEALTSINKAIRINANNADYWYLSGLILKAFGDMENAERSFNKSFSLGPITYHKEAELELAGSSEKEISI
jgi:tetratricopeptide (TPR) repeat protein